MAVIAPSADHIRWDLEPAPWSDSAKLLDLAADAIPTIADDNLADLFEAICLLVIERDEQIASMRGVSSVALSELHAVRLRVDRLQRRVIELRDLASANATARERQLKGKERKQNKRPEPTTTSTTRATTRATTRTRQRGHANDDTSVAEQRGH